MTDKEVLLIAYGAMKTEKYNADNTWRYILDIIEKHLFAPPPTIVPDGIDPLAKPGSIRHVK